MRKGYTYILQDTSSTVLSLWYFPYNNLVKIAIITLKKDVLGLIPMVNMEEVFPAFILYFSKNGFIQSLFIKSYYGTDYCFGLKSSFTHNIWHTKIKSLLLLMNICKYD